MPSDPKECREHAKRSLQFAHEATNQVLRASLEEIARQWLRLAADLEATKPLLEAWGDPRLSAAPESALHKPDVECGAIEPDAPHCQPTTSRAASRETASPRGHARERLP